MHAAKAAKRAAAAAAGDGVKADGGSGSNPEAVERDKALGLRTARAIARDPKARDADKLTAARLLAGVEEVKVTAKPPSIERLGQLSTAELEAIVLAHCWPS